MPRGPLVALLALIASFLIWLCPLTRPTLSRPKAPPRSRTTPTITVTQLTRSSAGRGFFSPSQVYGGLEITVGKVEWGGEDPDVTQLTGSSWPTVKVSLSVRCILSTGCTDISVMDFSLVCDGTMAAVIYGSQEEFEKTDLLTGENTVGSITFAFAPGGQHFQLRYAPKPAMVAEFSR